MKKKFAFLGAVILFLSCAGVLLYILDKYFGLKATLYLAGIVTVIGWGIWGMEYLIKGKEKEKNKK